MEYQKKSQQNIINMIVEILKYNMKANIKTFQSRACTIRTIVFRITVILQAIVESSSGASSSAPSKGWIPVPPWYY